ncbi:arylsulfatase B-like isoform X1 [Amblyomma americanum]
MRVEKNALTGCARLPAMFLWLLFISVVCVTGAAKKKSPPHIVFVLADDLGWADTSFHGSAQIPTPNLDALASTGVLLNNYYVQSLCSPSRGALMTGLYPAHNGIEFPLLGAEPTGLPLEYKIMPEHLKDLGYETHLVGKWHLGYHNLDYTPTSRGFDSFYGLHNGPNDYYKGIMEQGISRGLDFWNNTEPLVPDEQVYATTAFTEQAKSIIVNRNTSKPLFLYLAHQATHSIYAPTLLEAPEINVAKFPYIGDEERTIYAGMVDALDQSMGELLKAFEEAQMLADTVIVFSTDNGGHPYTLDNPNRGFNWPLRGMKGTLWEGGIRASAFIWSPRLAASRRVSTQLMHVSDWLPTLYSAAGGNVKNLGPLDGVDMWQALSKGILSPRFELLHDTDTGTGHSAIRYGHYKLLVGSFGAPFDTRYEVIGGSRPYRDLDVLLRNCTAAAVLRRLYGDPRLFERGYEKIWRIAATVGCKGEQNTNFESGQKYYLFDLAADPCELRNLADKRPALLSFLVDKLTAYAETARPPIVVPLDPRGLPENNNGIWAPWVV